MNIRLFAAGIFLTGALGAMAQQATVTLPKGDTIRNINVSHALLSNMLTARSQADMKISEESVPVTDGMAVIKLDPAGAARYSISLGEDNSADFYAAPDETLRIDVVSVNPLDYSVAGTLLMEGMTGLEQLLRPVEARQKEIIDASDNGIEPAPEAIEAIRNDYYKILRNFIRQNPDNPAAVYALMNLDSEDFLEAFSLLGDNARASLLYPFAEARKPAMERRVEQERKQKEMASGKYDAPGFTLPSLDGKEVSLSQFKGKWVILDFWGSWCIWCIKGFPHLKEAYEAYKDRLEVIGIDCGDTMDAWKAAVEKYQLPWVNVYKEESDKALLEAYGVQGFPTKAIVNPKGKIVDITTGEDPAFYKRLEAFMAK